MGNCVIRLSRAKESLLVESAASLLQGGIGLLQAYRAATEMLRGTERTAALAIVSGLERGLPVTESVRGTLHRVDPMHLAMLRVVDETGEAATPMARADRYLRSSLEFRSRVLTASMYPAFVVFAALIGSVLLILVAVPAAASLVPTANGSIVPGFGLATGNGSAPRAARAVVITVVVLVVVLVLVVALSAVVVFARRTEPLRLRLARIRLALPVAGRLEMLTGLLAFAHALAGMLEAGIPFTGALRAATGCPHNVAIRAGLSRAAGLMENGTSASAAVARALPRDDYLSRWFALCESGADLPGTIDGLATFLETRLAALIRRIAALVEPILVALAGAVVLTVVLTLVKPLFDLYAEVLP